MHGEAGGVRDRDAQGETGIGGGIVEAYGAYEVVSRLWTLNLRTNPTEMNFVTIGG
ncbi:hypothetical protein GCM10022270_23960 [Terriglobus aquaticus]